MSDVRADCMCLNTVWSTVKQTHTHILLRKPFSTMCMSTCSGLPIWNTFGKKGKQHLSLDACVNVCWLFMHLYYIACKLKCKKKKQNHKGNTISGKNMNKLIRNAQCTVSRIGTRAQKRNYLLSKNLFFFSFIALFHFTNRPQSVCLSVRCLFV